MSFTISVISVLSGPRIGERLWVQWGAKYASGDGLEAARAAMLRTPWAGGFWV